MKNKDEIVKIIFENPLIIMEDKTIQIKDIDFKNVYVVNYKSK